MGLDMIGYAYASAVAVGGVAGYAKAGSIASLSMGLLFGGILGFGAYQTSQDPSNYFLSLGASAVLTGVMGSRFYNSGKLMPAGLVAAISLAMVLRYSARGLGLVDVRNGK